MSWAGGGDLRVTVTVPRSERRSIEAFAGIYRGNDSFDTRGVYGFQIALFIPVGVRVAAGVSIPLGRVSSNNPR